MLFLLDTTVLIDHLRGAPAAQRVAELLDRGDVAATTAINVEEIARGLRRAEGDAARRLIDGLVVISLGRNEGWLAGTWRRDYAAKGRSLSQADCLVAAAAATTRGMLVTGNPKDFPMKEVTVEHWPVGS
ncbi:MAG: PIN domain-containing protein [Actinomycetota bacterium]|nr:PIN domain-containing protein [Actinomycetota bacterium]